LTPDAYFLPDVSASAGVALDIGFPEALPDGLFVDGSVKYDSYTGFSVATVTAGAGYRFSDMLTAYVRWIHSEGGGMTSDGYLARVDLQPMENVRLFAGYSDAPEVTTVTLDDVRTFFAGLSVDVSDQFSISASFTNEKRPTFERQVFGLGLSHRF
jgi:YaiO family outer membrane protein